MNAFTIKDLENLSGIKAHTIRIWEQRYSFLKPNRTDTNIRYYSNDQLKTVLNISLLNKYGFKISHIDRMTDSEIQEKILSLTNAQAQQERVINELIRCMMEMELGQFEEVLNSYVHVRGIERTIMQIIFPFLERIGILWITNHINPAQEHLVSNIIRQKLVVGIETTVSHIKSDKTLLLFLPEGEHHELGLLFAWYLFKSRGVKILYIGADTPLKDVAFVVKAKQPDYLYTHLTTVSNHFNFERFLTKFKLLMPSAALVVSGQVTQVYKKKTEEHIFLKRSIAEVMEFIASL
ncbi:MAG TPA: MerR family transcriptional regulator [Panacibacter sp.]|nr:MerR family transcriptional regulator [Panacibacter sp.]HNP46712.1 MerR family transcriptional regulator [Panacibacter sp.]